MNDFIAKHQDQLTGTLAGFDRLVFRGTLRSIATAKVCPSPSGDQTGKKQEVEYQYQLDPDTKEAPFQGASVYIG